MMLRKRNANTALVMSLLCLACVANLPPAGGQESATDKAATTVYPVAVFAFQERGREVSELGKQVTDLLFANLAVNPDLYLVEREDLA